MKGVLGAAILALFAVPASAQETLDGELLELLRGTWKIVGQDGKVVQDCDKGQHFEPDVGTRHILLTEAGADFTANYLVLHTDKSRILTYIEDEDRLTDAGDPVLWWAYFKDRDRFVWRRYDWPRSNATGSEWVRCDTEPSSAR